VRDRGRQQQQVTSVASDVIIVLYFDIHVLYCGESREQTPTYDSRVTFFGDLGGAMPQVVVADVVNQQEDIMTHCMIESYHDFHEANA
jgi:hypothetical protein